MECCKCEKEIDPKDEDSYLLDYVGDVWCKGCMKEELKIKY